YYAKRPSVRDPRLALLPPTLFPGARVLDIGCNEGWVTCEIGQSWGAHRVVGVDIDDTLIRAAWRRRRVVWSLQQPNSGDIDSTTVSSTKTKKRKRDHIPDEPPHPQPDYFPASCEHEFGSLPIPPSQSQSRGRHVFPHNVSFRQADWLTTHIPEDDEGYNVVIAFSISKWIHLNNGDDGLREFFKRIFEVLKPGGTFVLEPQAWDTYGKAKRMDEKLKENAKKLTIRPEDFGSILGAIGFSSPQHFGVAGEGALFKPLPSSLPPQYNLASRKSPLLTNGHRLGGQYEQSWVDSMPIGDIFLDLMVKAWDNQSQQKRENLSPKPLLGALGQKYNQYLDFAQQDAHEFLRILLDASRMEELDVIKKRQPPPENPKKRRRTTVTPTRQPPTLPPSIPEEEKLATLSDMIFGGKFASILVCRECKNVSQTYEDFNDISLSIKAEDYHSRKRDRFKNFAKRLTAFQPSLGLSNEIPRPSSVPPTPGEGERLLAGHEEPPLVDDPRRRSFDVVADTHLDVDGSTPTAKEVSSRPTSDTSAQSKGKHVEMASSAKAEKKDKNDGWAKFGRRISMTMGMKKSRSRERNNKEPQQSVEAPQMESVESGDSSTHSNSDAVPSVDVISPSPIAADQDRPFLFRSTTSPGPATPSSHHEYHNHPHDTQHVAHPHLHPVKAPKAHKPTASELSYLREILADIRPSSSSNPFTFLKHPHPPQGKPSSASQNIWLSMNHFSGIEECLRMFTSVEVLDDENMVGCRRCWKIANGEYEKPLADEDDSEDAVEPAKEDLEPPPAPVIANGRLKHPSTDLHPLRPPALTRISMSMSTPTVSLYTHSNVSDLQYPSSLPTTAPSSIHESDIDALPPTVKLVTPNQATPPSTPGGLPIPFISTTGPDPPVRRPPVRSSSLPLDSEKTPTISQPHFRLGQVLNYPPSAPALEQSNSLPIPRVLRRSDDFDESSGNESDISVATSVQSLDPSTPNTIPARKKAKQVIMRPAFKRYLIGTPPPVLVIHLKRFQQISKTNILSFSHGFKKLDDFIAFPEFLNLAPFLAPRKEDFGLGKKSKSQSGLGFGWNRPPSQDEKCMYRLYAVIVHIGNMLGGHYVAYTALPDARTTKDSDSGDHHIVDNAAPRQWAYISDTIVRLTPLEEVLKAKAYICMYERI
ncbi:hypothetical protein H0H93_015423, partial [Arthromyces matolae]